MNRPDKAINICGSIVAISLLVIIFMNIWPTTYDIGISDEIKKEQAWFYTTRDIGILRSAMGLEIRIYKNGDLVLRKVGDPILDNFALLIGFGLMDDQASYSTNLLAKNPSGGDVTGALFSWVYGAMGSSGSVDFKRNVYILFSSVQNTIVPSTYSITYDYQELVLDGSIIYDSTNRRYEIHLFASHSFDAAYTLQSVGLQITIYYSDAGYSITLLLAADNLPNAISVNPGEIVTVEYVFYIEGGA